MEHLSLEVLARLLDETPTAEERRHLERCRRCRNELDALEAQRSALSHLPDGRPPSGGWDRLEVRLRREGLIREGQAVGGSAGLPASLRGASPWWQLAAAVVLLLAGGGLGTGFGLSLQQERTVAGPGGDTATLTALEAETLSLEEAETLVRLTEGWYLEALVRYHEEAGRSGSPTPLDPLTRYAALETLMAAGHAAVRELPTDPFLNGLLVNMEAERTATLRGMQATTTQNWY